MNRMSLTSGTHNEKAEPELQLTKILRRSKFAIFLLCAGFGGALTLVPISGAVIAGGEVAIASGVKKIAHPVGGVISAIEVSNGDRVKKDEILLRFDTNVSAAGAAMTVESIDQLLAREARLRAERDGLRSIPFPESLTTRLSEKEVSRIIDEERRSFTINRQAISSQRQTISQQINQAGHSINGYQVQADVYRRQEALIAEERDANDKLWEKGYTTLQRRNELHRAAEGVRGNVASAETSEAQTRARIAELQERIYLLEDNARKAAGEELAEVQTRLISLRQSNIVAQDTNSRNLVRAPSDGVIDKLAFSTVGGVVPAGETIMEIVPDNDMLIVTARVSPKDVDQLLTGKDVMLRFSAFEMQTTPEIMGTLSKIGADRTTDAQLGVAYYPVEVSISKQQISKLGSLKLRPGMPVEAFFKTGDRTLFAYLFKPLMDQIARAFR